MPSVFLEATPLELVLTRQLSGFDPLMGQVRAYSSVDRPDGTACASHFVDAGRLLPRLTVHRLGCVLDNSTWLLRLTGHNLDVRRTF